MKTEVSPSLESMELLRIDNLTIQTTEGKPLLVLPKLVVKSGEIHAIIGESGSGKSLTLLTVIGLLSNQLKCSGNIAFSGMEDLFALTEKQWLTVRGKSIGMVFQEPMTALNPQQTCGQQLIESARIHGAAARQAEEMVEQKFSDLGLMDIKDRILSSYPHQLSGGQRQRVMIAMACLHNPPLILADEPTTALDSVSRKAVMDDLYRLCKKQGSALLWVSHELDLVFDYADTVSVLKRGELLDQGPKTTVLGSSIFQAADSTRIAKDNSLHPRVEYVRELLEALPKDNPGLRSQVFPTESRILEVRNLNKVYQTKGKTSVRALQDICFNLHAGETLALVGLSGSGKSTLAKILVGLESKTSGEIHLSGKPLNSKPPTGIQMVFQDPYSSLNPNQTAKMSLMEIFRVVRHQTLDDAEKSAQQSIREVGLQDIHLNAWPRELSGGQRQRLCIAKALATNPNVLILDEAVAALDPIVQQQVLALLVDLQQKRNMAFLFITHNLHVARNIAHHIIYLEQGVLGSLPTSWDSLK